MDDLQFLKDEITSNKFNKRIFYAKNALRYTEIMPINFFIDNYIPFIINYLYLENVEEVLTEYSQTLIFFLKFLGMQENHDNYLKTKTSKEEEIENDNYTNSINLIIKCIFEKILQNINLGDNGSIFMEIVLSQLNIIKFLF